MTSLRIAIKASLNVGEKPSKVRPPPRGNRARTSSDDSTRHQRRHGGDDAAAGERQGLGAHSDRNRVGGSVPKGVVSRRGRSSTREAEDAASDGSNHKIESESDGSVATSGRGRSSLHDRRQGTGNAVKREKTEPVPVSPPRQSIIAAAHEAKVGSQIKVRFDTGDWFSGIISEVHKQRGIIGIDYDDGTKETARIPDSDVVIYPWRPPERRGRAQETRAGGKAGGDVVHSSGSSRKHGVKSEPSPRRRPPHSRDRGSGGKRDPSRGGRSNSSHGGRGGSKVVSSPSSYEDDSGEGDDADDESGRWDEKTATTASSGSRKNGRWQQRNGGKGAARGRGSPHRQAPQRKRPAVGAGARNHSAPKRQRLARHVNVTSVNDGGPSGSVSEILSVPSEDEEELDDASLGIKTRKNPRAGIRRKLPPKTVPPKNKGRLRRGNYETLMASGDGPATSTAGSSAMSESSLSDSDSSSSNSSSNGLTENAVGSGSEVQVKAPIKAGDVQASRKDEDGQSKPEENDGAGLDVKERSQGRGKAGQESNGEQPKDDAHTPDEPAKQLPKEEKSQSPPRSKASDSGSAPTAAASAAVSAAAKSRQPNIKQSNAPRGWQESSESVVHNRHGAAQDQGVNSKSQNGPETAGLRGRGRAVRGQGSRGGSKARQQSTRPGRLETSSRSVEGGQQEQQQKRVENSRPDETSSSVPQKCAEEKAQSANLSNLRKSPRSKETPSRLSEGTRRAQHGAPAVAEAKFTPAAAKPPTVPSTEASTGCADFYGWESLKQPKQAAPERVTEKQASNLGEKVRVHHKNGPGPAHEVLRVSCGVSGSVPVKSQPSTVAGAGKKDLKKKLRKRSDVNDGRSESWPQSDVEGAESKATRGKGAPNMKPKGKANNVAKSAVPPAIATNSKVGDAHPAPTAVALPEDSAVDSSEAASKALSSNDVIANGSRETKTGSVADADAAVHIDLTEDDVASLAPEVVNDQPKEAEDLPTSSVELEVSAAVSPRNMTDDDAMDLDSSADDASLSDEGVVKRRLYNSDSGEGEPDTPTKLLENPAPPKKEEDIPEIKGQRESLPIDDTDRFLNALKPKATDSVIEETILKRVTKPARKRPRNEEKPAPGAKSDWPAPVVSRAVRPESESEDVDKARAGILETTPNVGTPTLDGESPVAGDIALSGSAMTVTEERKMPTVSGPPPQTPLKEAKAETIEGVNSPTMSTGNDSGLASLTKDKGSMEPAEKSIATDGVHNGRGPGSSEDLRSGADGDKVGAPLEGSIDRDEVDTEPEVSTENYVPDKIARDVVDGVDMKENDNRTDRHRPRAESSGDGGASRVETSNTVETAPFTTARVNDSSDKGPSTTPADDSGSKSDTFSNKPESQSVVESCVDQDAVTAKDDGEVQDRETPDEAAQEKTTTETRSRIKAEAKEESDAEEKDRNDKNNAKMMPIKHARSDSGDGQSGSDGSGAMSGESRPVGRRRSGVSRFEPSMETDRNRFGQHRPERHERQAAVLATKRLAASAPTRRASRGGRGHESGSRGRGRGRRGARGGRGSRTIVRERLEESDDDDDDDDEGGDGVDWVQCDNCSKWWTLPTAVNAAELPDVWHCRMKNWGKPVVDCLVPKEQRKSGTGAALVERRVAGKGSVRSSSCSPEPISAFSSVTTPAVTSEATATISALATGTAVSPEHVTAAAEAEAAVALVAATAAVSALEDTKTALRREETDVSISNSIEVREANTDSKRSSRPALLTNPTTEAPGRPPLKVAAHAHVPAKLPPEKPPPVLPTDDPERRIVRGVEKPATVARRRRRREGTLNFSSSDEECGRSARDVATNAHVEESRPRSNSVGSRLGGSSRGRVRKNSMGREDVAVLVKASESRRDSEPPSEDAEGKAGLSGGSCVTRSGGGGVVGSGSSVDPVSKDEWVMCDHKTCGKWRRLPPGVNLEDVDKWYCEMATWSPATANCDYPEDTTEKVAPATNTSTRGNGNAGSGGGVRGRRVGSRSTRSACDGGEGGGEEDKSWRRDGEGVPVERRSLDGSAYGNGVGRGRGRARKDELLWVQCDKCEKWRKLANGMRNEDLPDKWYCQMNNWSYANDCSYPDEYDAETNQVNGDMITSWVVDTRGGGGRVSAGGLLARGASGINKKANGRLSYRDILFNNDGKLKPPYSAGPSASASAGYLFPKPGDICASGVESETPEDLVPSRTGFHFSEKYCPVTGPERPPPRQDLLAASWKLTRQLTPSLARPVGEAPGDYLCSMNGHGMQQPMTSSLGSSGRVAGDVDPYNEAWKPQDDRVRMVKISSSGKTNGVIEPPTVDVEARAAASVMARGAKSHSERIGTYERQRVERCLVLHYLREATMPWTGQETCHPPESNGTTAARLLAAMRKRPWEGTPNAGTLEEWRAWLDHLEPTLERHLRWLVVDGLAARSDSNGAASGGGDKEEARYVAVVSTVGGTDFDIWTGRQGSAGHLAYVSAGLTGARTGDDGVLGTGTNSSFGLPMVNGGIRVMKSRPIKMVKPWR